MKTISYVGEEEYHSTDPWNNDCAVDFVEYGQAVEVSDQKAGQLLSDFPDLFTVGKADAPPKKRAPKKQEQEASSGEGSEGEPSREELAAKTRPELNDLAAAAGVADADQLANKGEVADAIVAAREG